jgi:hypothetical protein
MKAFGNNLIMNNLNLNMINNHKDRIDLKKNTKLSEFNCYLKIEKNGINYNVKNFINSSLQKILIFDKVSETNIMKRMIYINNSSNETILSFEITKINKIIDKFITQGKITIILNKDNLIIFISNSTKEILNNFIKYTKLNNNSDNNIDNSWNKIENISKGIINDNNLNLKIEKEDIRFGKKRKFKDLHKNFDQNNSNNNETNEIIRKNFEKNLLSKKNDFNNINNIPIKINSEKNKYINYFQNMPQIFIIDIFKYLDKENSNNFSLINKFIKKIHDGFMENLELRSETPAIQIKNILQRYYNLLSLKFGKGKKIKNEIFKNFCSNLKNLKKINLSHIDSLNESSIKKIFSKTKVENLIEIKINFDLNCLNSILNYINTFTKNLESFCFDSKKKEYLNNENELNIINNIDNSSSVKIFENLFSINKVTSLEYHALVKNILIEKKNLKKINSFLLNFNLLEKINIEKKNISNDFSNGFIIGKDKDKIPEFKIFSNLKVLKIKFLVIKNLRDLLLLKNCINIEYLSIKNILLLQKSLDFFYGKNKKNINISECDYGYSNYIVTKINFNNFKINIEEIERELNNNFQYINENLNNIDIKNNYENTCINNIQIKNFELHEDYIEIFVQIFSKIRKLKTLKLGDFINGEILNIICTFSKGIEILKIDSNEINDDDLILIMNKLINLKELDLRGSNNLHGSCFMQIQKFPQDLKKIKLSIQSFNFYKVIDYLKSKNIEARNYI